jgi:hypothetical protein
LIVIIEKKREMLVFVGLARGERGQVCIRFFEVL